MMMEKVCLTTLPILLSVCSEVCLFERENVEFKDVVPFNVSADRPQVSVKGNCLSQLDTGSSARRSRSYTEYD